MYQNAINKKFGTSFDITAVFCSQLIAVAFGMDGSKDAMPDRNMIKPVKQVDWIWRSGTRQWEVSGLG